MKLKTIAKGVIAASALATASAANAGVVATSYLNLDSLGIQVDVNFDGEPDALPEGVTIEDIITITSSTRGGNTGSSYTGYPSASDGDSSNSTALPDVNAEMACSGPDCGPYSDNFFLTDGAVNDLGGNYGIGDMFVSGSALSGGASGFTYADAATTQFATDAGANGTITNQLSATLSFLSDVAIRFIGVYDMFTMTAQDPGFISDPTINATATAGSNLTLNLSGGSVLSSAFLSSNDSLGAAGEVDLVDQIFTSNWSTFSSGSTGSLFINQSSSANVSLVPEPSTIALFGGALLGLAGFARRRKSLNK